MKKYYELIGLNLVTEIEWLRSSSIEEAKKVLKHNNIREISYKEFNRLKELYTNQIKIEEVIN